MEVKKEEVVEEPKEIKLGPDLIKGEHEFFYKSGSEVECKTCPIGYGITPGTEIKNGNLFIHGEQIL